MRNGREVHIIKIIRFEKNILTFLFWNLGNVKWGEKVKMWNHFIIIFSMDR